MLSFIKLHELPLPHVHRHISFIGFLFTVAIFETPCVSVSKRVFARNLSTCENEFDLHENEHVWMVSYEESFWNRGKRELGNGYLLMRVTAHLAQIAYFFSVFDWLIVSLHLLWVGIWDATAFSLFCSYLSMILHTHRSTISAGMSIHTTDNLQHIMQL